MTRFTVCRRRKKGIRPARALPFSLNVQASVSASNSAVSLTFVNTGSATAVFQVRSANPSDLVREYTVEPNKSLSDTWSVPLPIVCRSIGPMASRVTSTGASVLVRLPECSSSLTCRENSEAFNCIITNVGNNLDDVRVLNAYTDKAGTWFSNLRRRLLSRLAEWTIQMVSFDRHRLLKIRF